MIKGIFVIHNSGICIYNKYISDISADVQLFSGFLTALYRFCNASIGEKISNFCTNTLKFNYIYDDNLFFVFIIDQSDLMDNLMPQFQKVIKKFYEEFANQQITFEK